MTKKKDNSFPIAGFTIGAIGIFLIGLLLSKEQQEAEIPKWLFIIIALIGGIIGSVVENYLKGKGFFNDDD